MCGGGECVMVLNVWWWCMCGGGECMCDGGGGCVECVP